MTETERIRNRKMCHSCKSIDLQMRSTSSGDQYWVQCMECGHWGGSGKTKDEANEKWNRRDVEDELREAIAKRNRDDEVFGWKMAELIDEYLGGRHTEAGKAFMNLVDPGIDEFMEKYNARHGMTTVIAQERRVCDAYQTRE